MNTSLLKDIYDNLVVIMKEVDGVSLAPMDDCYVVDGVQFCVPIIGGKAQNNYDMRMLLKRKCKFKIEYDISPSPGKQFEDEDDALDAFFSGNMEFGIYFVIPRNESVQKYKDCKTD